MGDMLGGGGGGAAGGAAAAGAMGGAGASGGSPAGMGSFSGPSDIGGGFNGMFNSQPQFNDYQTMSNGGNFSLSAQPQGSDFKSMGQGGSFQLTPGGDQKVSTGKPGFDWQKFGQQLAANMDFGAFKPPVFKPTQYQFNETPFNPIQQAQAVQVAAPVIKGNVQGALNSLYPGAFSNLSIQQ